MKTYKVLIQLHNNVLGIIVIMLVSGHLDLKNNNMTKTEMMSISFQTTEFIASV